MGGYDDDFDCDVNDNDGQSQIVAGKSNVCTLFTLVVDESVMRTMLTNMRTFQYLPHIP